MSEQPGTRSPAAAGAVAQRAQTTVRYCWIAGLTALVIGVLIDGVNFPTAEPAAAGGSTESGSQAGFAFGLLLAAVGQVVVLVAVIATGVRLGTESAARSR